MKTIEEINDIAPYAPDGWQEGYGIWQGGYIQGQKDAANEKTFRKADIADIIKKEIERANRYYDQKLSSTQMAASIRVVSVLSELIGEKFPYEELHMGFATMD